MFAVIPGSRRGGQHKKGSTPLSTPALTRAVRRTPAAVSKRSQAEETYRMVLARLDDMKAEDITTIDLAGKSSIADVMVVASGRSQRHVASTAENVVKDLKAAGMTGIRVEGQKQADWVLIDAGDVIVHVFRPEVRAFYDLEKMWKSAPKEK